MPRQTASGKEGRFRIRKADLRDLPLLVRQRRSMWENMGVNDGGALDQADIVYRRWARKSIKEGTLLGWIAEDKQGRVAGTGCLWIQPIQPRPRFDRGTQPYLLSMYTEPRFRGRGVASRIVGEAVRWSRRNRYPSLRLHASEMGRKLYRKLGFRRAWEMKIDLEKRRSPASSA